MSMETDEPPKLDNLILGEIQVLLAEKQDVGCFEMKCGFEPGSQCPSASSCEVTVRYSAPVVETKRR
jgi:hypothetical protein